MSFVSNLVFKFTENTFEKIIKKSSEKYKYLKRRRKINISFILFKNFNF